ncbi:hypothetical protein ABMY26_06495 (plasmid) [Azospirillum sp. HJ39]|uniref:hypothetical protein n=1 Tax=Azospirillum sp. HJ39 TaxID=3159496 RepID=UPI00355638C6
MSIMVAELYDALRDGGTSDEKARKAAEAVASYEGRFADLNTKMTLLQWMVGFNLAATVGIMMMLLKH